VSQQLWSDNPGAAGRLDTLKVGVALQGSPQEEVGLHPYLVGSGLGRRPHRLRLRLSPQQRLLRSWPGQGVPVRV